MIISTRQTFKDENGKSQPAIRWLLDILTSQTVPLKHKVFRIENDQVLNLLGLKPREGFFYAAEEFADLVDDPNVVALNGQGGWPSSDSR
jgi:hypothetical protein